SESVVRSSESFVRLSESVVRLSESVVRSSESVVRLSESVVRLRGASVNLRGEVGCLSAFPEGWIGQAEAYDGYAGKSGRREGGGCRVAVAAAAEAGRRMVYFILTND
ncbi:MAG: hypothetical protein LBF90_06790, partial [Prevotellaceae bacterium]|nr:hypothetical protein [Prevotellaceae bacterium]